MSSRQPPPGAMDSGNSSQNIVLHVLCPSLPQPNRFTLRDVDLSITVIVLKARIAQSIPSHPSPENQRLFYLGKPLLNDNATLQTVLGPLNASEFSMHLVLPPAPPQATGSSRSPIADRAPLQQNPLFPSRFAPNNPTHTQGLRYRGPTAPTLSSEAEIGLALRQNVDAIRRQLDMRQQGIHIPGTQASQHTAPTPHLHTSSSSSSQIPWQHTTPGLSHPALSPNASAFTMSSNLFGFNPGIGNPNMGSYLPEEIRLRLQVLTQQVTSVEEQLNRGIAPPLDHVILIRSQLFNLLDDQYRRPVAQRNTSVESLLSRVLSLYTRADQLRTVQARFPTLNPSSPQATAAGPSQAPLYLLSSPGGYQALVASPNGTAAMQSSLDALRANQPPVENVPVGGGHPANVVPNANPAVLENVVRQAVLNQQAAENDQLGLTRNIRRLWLFVRLYFFCHMLTTPGTWTRLFFVATAVVVSILSETSYPRQFYQMILAPVQRHLEGLVHFTPEEHTPLRPQGQEATVDQQPALQGGFRHNVRRVERSLALFIASLVPGVGERHVQVRNEAVRNAERAREEEERLRLEAAAREEEQDSQPATDSGPTGPDTATDNEPPAIVPEETNH